MGTAPPTDPQTPASGSAASPAWEPATRFYRQLHIVGMALLILVLLVYLLQQFSFVLQQLFTAALISYLILPAHHWLVRRRVPPFLAYGIIVLGVLAVSYGLGLMLYHSFEDLQQSLPEYQENLTRLIGQASRWIPELDAETLEQMVRRELPTLEANVSSLRSALGTLFGFLSQLGVMLIYLVFLLAEQTSIPRRIHKAFEPGRAQQILNVIQRINGSIAQYLAVKTLMSFLTGLFTTVVLVLFGVKYAVLWGVVAFLLNYIPYLGSVVAALLPVLLSLVQYGSPWRTLVILILLLVVHNAIGYVIEPLVAGRRLDLSPLVIIVSLAFWGSIWGIVGMILAVPLVVTLKAILENIPQTRPIAVLLSNQ